MPEPLTPLSEPMSEREIILAIITAGISDEDKVEMILSTRWRQPLPAPPDTPATGDGK
jgi:hypothetical protein